MNNPNLDTVWDKKNNFKNFASYNAKQCDWMESGVGSIKRPTKGQMGTWKTTPNSQGNNHTGDFKCFLRLRSHESFNQKFRILKQDEEVQCFAKSEHNITGGRQDVDKEIARKVVAITKEFTRHC